MKESVKPDGGKTVWAKAALILVAILWGSSLVVAKSSIDHISPSLLIALRFTIACALLRSRSLWSMRAMSPGRSRGSREGVRRPARMVPTTPGRAGAER